ncbi:MAG: cupin domain-containing protein, partial [Haloarculaceae archaeon]
MHVSSTDTAPALSRGDGVVSRLLNPDSDGSETDLTVTWVTVDPGATQTRHSHEPEQVYVLVAGRGEMTVGDETRTVEAGDLVHIPSNADHAIENTGDQPLEYVSAATPAIPRGDVEAFYRRNRPSASGSYGNRRFP